MGLYPESAQASLDLAHSGESFARSPLNGTTTSMIIEQYQLNVFARRVGVEVGTLLPLAPTRKQVAKAGYAHLTGGAKREDKWIAKAEARLAAWPRLAVESANGSAARDCSAAVIAAAF